MKNCISPSVETRQPGFTLIELLVVSIIIVALIAILAPNILSYRSRVNVRQAESQIGLFWRALEDYATEYGKYPATEQGLKALIFIPANEAVGIQPGLANMQQGAGLTAAGDPNSMLGGAAAVGTGTDMTGSGMMQPGMTDPNGIGMGGAAGIGMQPSMNGMTQPGMTDPTGMGTAGAIGTGVQPGMMQPGMTDPTGMSGMMQYGTQGTGAFGLGMSNPNLYTAMKKRSTPFIAGDDVPLDPWKNPYRYDNSFTATGVNPFTGEKKPAIWSAGPDGLDGTEDDIRSWNPKVAQAQMMNSQQTGMGMMPNGMTDPTGMGMTDPNAMSPNGIGVTDPNMNMMQPSMMNSNGAGGMQPNMMMQPNVNMMQPNIGQPSMNMMQPNMMNPNGAGGMPVQPAVQPVMPVVPQ